MEKIDVFIPAGTGEKYKHYSELLEEAKVDNKALIELNKRPMISYIIETLDNSECVKSITIFGLNENQISIKTKKPITYLEGGNTLFNTITKALEYYKNLSPSPKYVMSVSSDIPLITPQMINNIYDSIDWSKDIELYYNVVWAKKVRELYPEITKIPLTLKEGDIYIGDIHIYSPHVLDDEKRINALKSIMGDRKNFFAAVKLISIKFIAKYKFKKLKFSEFGLRIHKLFNLKGGVILGYPETCIDLDYVSDLENFKILTEKSRRNLTDKDQMQVYTYEDLINKKEIIPF